MSDNEQEKKDGGVMIKVATFIVDKRNLFFLLFAIAIIFSAVASSWTAVENSLSEYLPETTETRQGLDIMENEFTTFGTAKVMIANLSYKQAEELGEKIEKMDGVSAINFDNTDKHFNNASALYDVTFAYDENEDKCLEALENLKSELSAYDMYISTSLGDSASEIIASEMGVISIYVAIIVVVVLFFTSKTYAEVPVLIITFLSSAIIHMGTNFVFGTISFVSDSVTVILQLALSVDYAIILCHRYREEHETLPAREATIIALSKAIPEISSSSLTTIGGLLAMTLMQFKIGPDMGIVLIKAILLSLMSVFLLMPGLLMLFSKAMDKSKHKEFVPPIPFVGKIAYVTRKFVPPVFVVIIVVSMILSNNCPFVYGYSTLTTPVLNDTQIASQMIEDNFGKSNMLALIVPAGNYESESRLLADLESRHEVESATGLANAEAMDGYHLTDKLTPRDLSELIDIDYEVAQLLFAAYAANDEDYGKILNGLPSYSVPLIDIFMFLYDEVEEGYVTLDNELQETLNDAYKQMSDAKKQLQSDEYSRMLIYLTLPEEGSETFAFLDEMHNIAAKYYGDSPVIVVGESTSQNDLRQTFETDNAVIGVVSILIVLAVLLFTFKSVGLPILLIMVIQGSIWINFAVPALQQSNLFFMSYLIVSSIQMGANIDYAIVISNRYFELKQKMSKKEAITETMNQTFPTIITSALILAIAGTLIGQMTSEAAIVGIGQCLGRGTFISIFLVMFVLPQLLLIGDRIIEKTSFNVAVPVKSKNGAGTIRVDGMVRGNIQGEVVGIMHARVCGNVSVSVLPGDIKDVDDSGDSPKLITTTAAAVNDSATAAVSDSVTAAVNDSATAAVNDSATAAVSDSAAAAQANSAYGDSSTASTASAPKKVIPKRLKKVTKEDKDNEKNDNVQA